MKTSSLSCEDCFQEFSMALEDLRAYSSRARKTAMDEPKARDLIRNFEATHELALTVINSYFQKQKKGPFSGSRDLTVEAFHADLIDDGKAWLDMIIDRIQYNPIYPIDVKSTFVENIQSRYIRLLERFEEMMQKELEK